MRDDKTDPSLPKISTEEILDYLVGAVSRIEAQIASDQPPPWAARLFARLDKLEATCKERHCNGGKHVGSI